MTTTLPPVSEAQALEHGLTADEFRRFCDAIGRVPNLVELGVHKRLHGLGADIAERGQGGEHVQHFGIVAGAHDEDAIEAAHRPLDPIVDATGDATTIELV